MTIQLLPRFGFGHRTPKPDIFDHSTVKTVHIWPSGCFGGRFADMDAAWQWAHLSALQPLSYLYLPLSLSYLISFLLSPSCSPARPPPAPSLPPSPERGDDPVLGGMVGRRRQPPRPPPVLRGPHCGVEGVEQPPRPLLRGEPSSALSQWASSACALLSLATAWRYARSARAARGTGPARPPWTPRRRPLRRRRARRRRRRA